MIATANKHHSKADLPRASTSRNRTLSWKPIWGCLLAFPLAALLLASCANHFHASPQSCDKHISDPDFTASINILAKRSETLKLGFSQIADSDHGLHFSRYLECLAERHTGSEVSTGETVRRIAHAITMREALIDLRMKKYY